MRPGQPCVLWVGAARPVVPQWGQSTLVGAAQIASPGQQSEEVLRDLRLGLGTLLVALPLF